MELPFLFFVCFINLAEALLPFSTLPGFVSSPAGKKRTAELLHGLPKPHGPEGMVAAGRQEATCGATRAGWCTGQCCWERSQHILLQQQEQPRSFLLSMEGRDEERGDFELQDVGTVHTEAMPAAPPAKSFAFCRSTAVHLLPMGGK